MLLVCSFCILWDSRACSRGCGHVHHRAGSVFSTSAPAGSCHFMLEDVCLCVCEGGG
jgi:hypothetical protein